MFIINNFSSTAIPSILDSSNLIHGFGNDNLIEGANEDILRIFDKPNQTEVLFPDMLPINQNAIFSQPNATEIIFPDMLPADANSIFGKPNQTEVLFPDMLPINQNAIFSQPNATEVIFPDMLPADANSIFNRPNLTFSIFPNAGLGITNPNLVGVVDVIQYDPNHLPEIQNPVYYEITDPIDVQIKDILQHENTVTVPNYLQMIPTILRDMNPPVDNTPIINKPLNIPITNIDNFPIINNPTPIPVPNNPLPQTPLITGQSIPITGSQIPERVVNTAGGFDNVSMQGQAYRSRSIPQLYGFSGVDNNQADAQTLISYIEEMYGADPDFKTVIDALIQKYGFVSATAHDLEFNTVGRATIGGNEIIIDTQHIQSKSDDIVKETIAHEFGHNVGYNHSAAHEAFIAQMIDGIKS